MTIKELIERVPDAVNKNGARMREVTMSTTDIWSNAACIGYCIAAMRREKMSDMEIGKLIDTLDDVLDSGISVYEAESIYHHFG